MVRKRKNKITSRTMANWSDLPSDLLRLILSRINCLRDFIGFRSVCSAWRSLAMDERFNCEAPWLMLYQKRKRSRRFLNPSEAKIYRNRIKRPPTRAANSQQTEFPLTSKGWILMSEYGTQFSLLNPFSLSKISLPEIHWTRDEYPFAVRGVVNFAISCRPSCSSGFMVMIIYGSWDRKLALYNCGDHDWTEIDTKNYRYNKITHLNGQFYVIGDHKHGDKCFVLEVEKIQDSISTRIIAYDDPWKGRQLTVSGRLASTRTWLAESCGALMMVFMKWGIEITRSHAVTESNYEFVVAELDLKSGGLKKVNDLGDCAIFLGDSFCSLVHQVSRHKYKSNHIYFLTNNYAGLLGSRTNCFKVYAYCIQDGTVDSLFEAPDQSAIWVDPRF